MNRRFGIALVAALALVVGNDALAAAQRTFVSGFGNDANPCTLAQPCRGFTAAIAQTVAGGEVIVLDSAAYGSVTITQSVSIIAPEGVYAGISVFSGSGINVSAGVNDIVALRNLTIVGLGGTNGIVVGSVGQLRLESLHVSGFTGGIRYGLLFASGGTLTVSRSVFEGNFTGIGARPPMTTTAKVEVIDCLLASNTEGYVQGAGGTATSHILRTTAAANLDGFVVDNVNGSNVMIVEASAATNNSAWGVAALSGAVVISNNSITGNAIGVNIPGAAVVQSRGSNTVVKNGTDVNGSIAPLSGT